MLEGKNEDGSIHAFRRANVKKTSERDLVVTRIFDAPARIVFAAWTTPELFMRWWSPRSIGTSLRSCQMDVRTGGKYRLQFGEDESTSWTFFGRYVEVSPYTRLAWTNDDEADGSVTTVTFEENAGTTQLTFHEHYSTKAALEEAMASQKTSTFNEQFDQLEELLISVAASGARQDA